MNRPLSRLLMKTTSKGVNLTEKAAHAHCNEFD